MKKEVSIKELAEKHFKEIGVSVNNAQVNNAITTVYTILKDEELCIEVLLKSLYRKGGD